MRALRARHGLKSADQLRNELGSAGYEELVLREFNMTMWLTVDVFFELAFEVTVPPGEQVLGGEHGLYAQVFGVNPGRVMAGAKDGSWTLGKTHRGGTTL